MATASGKAELRCTRSAELSLGGPPPNEDIWTRFCSLLLNAADDAAWQIRVRLDDGHLLIMDVDIKGLQLVQTHQTKNLSTDELDWNELRHLPQTQEKD